MLADSATTSITSYTTSYIPDTAVQALTIIGNISFNAMAGTALTAKSATSDIPTDDAHDRYADLKTPQTNRRRARLSSDTDSSSDEDERRPLASINGNGATAASRSPGGAGTGLYAASVPVALASGTGAAPGAVGALSPARQRRAATQATPKPGAV
jgi:hypothetical protein